jgi:hypothetical protein
MAEIQLEQLPVGDPGLKAFVRVPWKLYRGDPCWTPPLTSDLLGSKLLGTKGLLMPNHPYHQDADATHFVARRGGELVGRVAAAVNHRYNEYHGTKIGNFGFFESINDFKVAKALLDAARKWVTERGMEVFRGPGEYSNATHERQGILIDGFEYPPTVELTHNPPYYAELMDRYGFRTAMDYHAYKIDMEEYEAQRTARIAERVAERRGITVRKMDLKRLDEEIQLILDIYNEAWSQNWGFLPITQAEGEILADSLRPVIIPELVRFAYIDGEDAAVFAALPDVYDPLRPRWRWPLDTEPVRMLRTLLQAPKLRGALRIFFFGVRPKFRGIGVDAVVFSLVQKYAMEKGYEFFEPSLLLDNNDKILATSARMGGYRYKTWRIYDMDL